MSDHEFVTQVPKHSKLKKTDSQSLRLQSCASNEKDDSLKQNVKTTGKIMIIFYAYIILQYLPIFIIFVVFIGHA